MEKINQNKAKCKYCSVDFACAGGNTSGLMRHVRSKHPTVLLASPETKTSQPKMPMFSARPVHESRSEMISSLIASLIAACMLPVSLVDAPAFVKLINFLEPNYKVPCRQTMTKRLDCQHNQLKEKIRTDLTRDKATKVTITTDIWTSLTNEAYLSVTASYISPEWKMRNPILATVLMGERHTSDYISQCLKKTTEEWNISDQILAVVHDGASNVKEVGKSNNWQDIGCAAHKLHLVVSAALGIDKVSNTPVSKCVAAGSRLVGHFSHSALATSELAKRQKAMNAEKPPLKLIQYCKTRWNSVYDMFERLVALRWPVTAVLSDRSLVKLADAKTLDMTDEHWSLMEELLPILQPLQVATALFSAADTPSASTVFPTVVKLLGKELAATDDDSPSTRSFKVCKKAFVMCKTFNKKTLQPVGLCRSMHLTCHS